MSQASYDNVAQAAANLREAQRNYLEARYINYRQRDVSPRNAHKVALEDLAEVSRHGIDHARSAFGYDHAEELNHA
jgi:hypothetical protein